MRILNLAPFTLFGSLTKPSEFGMPEGFVEAGHEWFYMQDSGAVPGYADKVAALAENFDTVFVSKGAHIPLEVFRDITDRCDVTYWTADSISRLPQVIGARALLCTRSIVTGTEGARWLKENNYAGRVAQVYLGCRHYVWKPGPFPRKHQDRVCFLGTSSYKGDCGRKDKLDAIESAGIPLLLSNSIFHEKASEVYWNSAVCLNLVQEGIVSDRVVRILSSGGFCLTERNVDVDHSFTDGEELATFEAGNIEHMLDQIYFYMSRPKLRSEIADRGFQWSRKMSHKNQMGKMCRFISGEDVEPDGAAGEYL